MLKTITSSLPALRDNNYTIVDVKFETGPNQAMDTVHAAQFEDSNSFQHVPFEEDSEEGLQTPSSSPPQESTNNKRKRSVPKKFSLDEDENPNQTALTNPVNITSNITKSETVVKTENVDYSLHTYEDIAVPEQASNEDWDEAALDQIDLNRINAAKINSMHRDDCPICGDKANGLHYGVYTCEGCKNFFKRSVVVTQKKPYICNNQSSCDVRIVIDMSGIKRKGARCQACRYTACLDAGMFHSGYPRSRGGRHLNVHNRNSQHHQHHQHQSNSSTPLLKDFLHSGERTDKSLHNDHSPLPKRLRKSLEETQDSSSWEMMLHGTPIEADPTEEQKKGDLREDKQAKDVQEPILINESILNHTVFDDSTPVPRDSDEMMAKASDIFDKVLRDELEKEKSKNKELSVRLAEKEKQLKIVERQTENMTKHMVMSQKIAKEQQDEIKRLRNEITRLTVFRSRVRNYQNDNNSIDHEPDNDLNPADLLSVSYNE